MDEIHFAAEDEVEEVWNPDLMELTSIGIDIGSSTSHLMFSRLYLQRRSLQLSSCFEVVEREILYRSPILLTPYQDPETIDTDELARFIAQSYTEADIDAAHIDTGAVICTGEAVRKKNAEAITRLFSSQAGKFVCATAGPNLEAVLAAHGSGAMARSQDKVVLNLDMGGGTTKLAIAGGGAILETAAINVGARLVAWDKDGRITRIEDAGRKVARAAGFDIALGQVLDERQKAAMVEVLADILFMFLQRRSLSPLGEELLVTPAPTYQGEIAQVFFSGGVSEYVYGRESQDYGDMGPLLGEAARKRVASLGLPLGDSAERIRATVIGASQYTIQVSSSTIFLSREDILPIRDLLVVTPHLRDGEFNPDGVARAIEGAFQRFDLTDHHRPIALSLRWPLEPSYAALRTLALGISQAMAPRNSQNPLVLVFDSDIGEELSHSQAVPVVVKSLVFG